MSEKTVIALLAKKNLTLAVAESCTGGLLSDSLTNIPGSSHAFLLGVVAYSNTAKAKVLGVSARALRDHGAVSKETALEMASGVRHIGASHIGIGLTGIAGPGGGSSAKPVGTVFIAISLGHHAYFKRFHFKGTRLSIKSQAKNAALRLLKECLTD